MIDKYELEYTNKGYNNIIGVDEVGRGPLAGPLVVAGVILKENITDINDSKKLTKKKISILSKEIIEKADYYDIRVISIEDIDKFGIKKMVVKAMEDIINDSKADFALIDFEKVNVDINNISITKGDSKSYSIAAASIIAKEYRDNLMKELDVIYPEYGFKTNAGYGTKIHMEALKTKGYIKGVHRTSYKPIKEIMED